MPWCPKCKSEYQEEVERCEECDALLLPFDPDIRQKLFRRYFPKTSMLTLPSPRGYSILCAVPAHGSAWEFSEELLNAELQPALETKHGYTIIYLPESQLEAGQAILLDPDRSFAPSFYCPKL